MTEDPEPGVPCRTVTSLNHPPAGAWIRESWDTLGYRIHHGENEMKQYTRIGALLLIAIALGFGAVPAVQAQETADLALIKALQTEGPIFAGDQVVWVLTLTNNGPAEATGIQVTEDMSGLGEYTLDGSEASEGTAYEDPVWSIPALPNSASATLTLTTTVAEDGERENRAEISGMDQEDTDLTNNEGSASTGVSPSTIVEITVKPETLNLRSRGVFTVFIRFGEDYPLQEINLGESSLVCNGAKPKRLQVTQKDGGTVVAKYRRQDLVDVVAGEEITITCEGMILFGEETVKVTGSDTIRVIGEKKKGLDAFLAGILDTVLPLEDETEEAAAENVTAAATPTPGLEQARNRGQLKKGNGDPVCTGDCSAADAPGTQGNGRMAGTLDDDTVTGSQGKGNQGNGKNADTGNGNGKGNSNSPDMEKGNSKGKK
jgi:hypothetical protein